MKIFEYVLIFWEGRTLKKGQIFGLKILFFFHFFFLKFGLACRRIEASQGFWYQGAGLIFSFEIDDPPICITVDVPVIARFP